MQIGPGCTVHLRADELPSGRLVVSVSKHLIAAIRWLDSFGSDYLPWVEPHNQVRKRFLNIGKPVIHPSRNDHHVSH
jgi:hypothetical protein